MSKAFATTIRIDAPAEKIWSILTDVAAWPSWNTTVDRVEGAVAPGSTVIVHAKINPGRTFPVQVAELAAPSRMVWRSGMPLGLFAGERTFELTAAEGGTTFAMREVYTGLLAPLITRSIPDLQPAFDEMAACLKRRAEG
jgi:hypothetical protein